jgi:hypothetical protein
VRGSPIRKSSDQRSVDSSPRLIAASYVLHRLLVPRHPPCALNNLATQKHRTPTPGRKRACGPTRTLLIRVFKMLASTVQFSTYDQTPPTRPRRTQQHSRRSTPQGSWWYEEQGGPARQRPPGTFVPGPALSGPNSVPTTGHPQPTPFPTTPEGRRTRSSLSCRPNWSAFHPRAPPHTLAGTR